MTRRVRMYTTPETSKLSNVTNQVNEFLSGIAPEDVISNQIIMGEPQGMLGSYRFTAVITYIGEVEG